LLAFHKNVFAGRADKPTPTLLVPKFSKEFSAYARVFMVFVICLMGCAAAAAERACWW